MEWKYKFTTLTGMWLASLVGAVYGLIFTIIGAGFDWGPGGGMIGPYWKILITGLISLLIGMYAGELIARRMAGLIFKRPRKRLQITFLMFLSIATASLIAWVLSWEAGFIAGILMGTIEWTESDGWHNIILNVGFMSAILGVPFALAAGVINGLIAWFVIKK